MVDSKKETDGLKNTIRESLQSLITNCSSDKEKGDTFLKWALTKLYELTADEAENAKVDGWHDGGIDAYWLIEEEEQDKEIYIIQGKFGSSHSDAQVAVTKAKIEKLLKTPPNKIERTDIADIVQKFKEATIRHLIYITDQEVSGFRDDITLQGMPIDFQIIGIDGICDVIWERIKEPAKGQWADLNFEKAMSYKDWYIAIVRLSELGKFVDTTKDYIFESNIRQFLKFRGKVNKGIRDTLKDNPEDFFYYNNGITIVAEGITPHENNTLSLYSPQIVNGAQTSNAVQDAWKRKHDIEGHLLVTIIKGNVEQVTDITKYRNSQNAVKGKDLLSLSNFHKVLLLQFFEKGYHYEIQSGKFDCLKASDKQRFMGNKEYNQYLEGIKGPYSIPSKDAVQSFIAGIIQSPTDAFGRPSDYLPNGSKYDSSFDEELKNDYRLFLFPWLVKEYAKNIFGYGKEAIGSEKKRATFYYVFAYFRTLAKVLKIEPDSLKAIDTYREGIDKVFKDFENNKKILYLVDEAVKKFLEDSAVDKKIKEVGGTESFFKGSADKEEMKAILAQKLDKSSEVLNEISACFNTT